MRSALSQVGHSLRHLFFPHVCRNCYREIPNREQHLCLRCIAELPYTRFADITSNPVEKIFYGRVHIEAATSTLFFTTSSIAQHLIHQVKYRGQRELAIYLGRIMGLELAASQRFRGLDIIVPLPLFRTRQKQRGYNQANLLAKGISDILNIPVDAKLVNRTKATATQTRRSRAERWINVDGLFRLAPGAKPSGGNILLVDDVITTGATLEACSRALLSARDTNLYIATLAYAMK